eukprot:Blabericola_migrator_1__8649@NODE_453_length_8332_cov_11_679492_g355_i0_p1_GENE_NODE_453_length_8332_cov_11_679492_g355_i0NODE_453_length_8332_cov_11_679492_g355_i0_p1_ORF_typecomplete_len1370_score144_66_NODE_453_length_8332_cov_11_679492_g355_i042218291
MRALLGGKTAAKNRFLRVATFVLVSGFGDIRDGGSGTRHTLDKETYSDDSSTTPTRNATLEANGETGSHASFSLGMGSWSSASTGTASKVEGSDTTFEKIRSHIEAHTSSKRQRLAQEPDLISSGDSATGLGAHAEWSSNLFAAMQADGRLTVRESHNPTYHKLGHGIDSINVFGHGGIEPTWENVDRLVPRLGAEEPSARETELPSNAVEVANLDISPLAPFENTAVEYPPTLEELDQLSDVFKAPEPVVEDFAFQGYISVAEPILHSSGPIEPLGYVVPSNASSLNERDRLDCAFKAGETLARELQVPRANLAANPMYHDTGPLVQVAAARSTVIDPSSDLCTFPLPGLQGNVAPVLCSRNSDYLHGGASFSQHTHSTIIEGGPPRSSGELAAVCQRQSVLRSASSSTRAPFNEAMTEEPLGAGTALPVVLERVAHPYSDRGVWSMVSQNGSHPMAGPLGPPQHMRAVATDASQGNPITPVSKNFSSCNGAPCPGAIIQSTFSLNEKGRQGVEQHFVPAALSLPVVRAAARESSDGLHESAPAINQSVLTASHETRSTSAGWGCDVTSSDISGRPDLVVPQSSSQSKYPDGINQLLKESELNVARSAAYDAAERFLSSSQTIPHAFWPGVMKLSRSYQTGCHMYGSPHWLMASYTSSKTSSQHAANIQELFEMYGYENIDVDQVFKRAVSLVHALEAYGAYNYYSLSTSLIKAEVSSRQLDLAAASEIIRDAFFLDQPLRPDFRTYLREKVLTNNDNKVLPRASGIVRELKGDIDQVMTDWSTFWMNMNHALPKTEHPLSFVTFCDDVNTILRSGVLNRNFQRRKLLRDEQSQHSSSTSVQKAPKGVSATKSVVTKYWQIFGVDLFEKLGAVVSNAPAVNGIVWLDNAIEEGYVPVGLFSEPWILPNNNVNWLCLSGAIAALYRSLLDSLPEAEVRNQAPDVKVIDPVREYLTTPAPVSKSIRKDKFVPDGFDVMQAAAKALPFCAHQFSLFSPEVFATTKFINLVSFTASYGSAQWVLSQVMQPYCNPRRLWRQGELQFALELLGFDNVNILDMFRRAHILASEILKTHAVERKNVVSRHRPFFIAAEIIKSAILEALPPRQDRDAYIRQRVRYQVLPAHKECLRTLMQKRRERHAHMRIRTHKGESTMSTDWCHLIGVLSGRCKTEAKHPLGFAQFFADMAVISKGETAKAQAVASKYQALFGVDLFEVFASISAKAPDVTKGACFVGGIEQGLVPYVLAYGLTRLAVHGVLRINENKLHLLGAIVDCYASLLGFGDVSSSQSDRVAPNYATDTPLNNKEEEAFLSAILDPAPPQMLAVTPTSTCTRFAELHPVTDYLLHGRISSTSSSGTS